MIQSRNMPSLEIEKSIEEPEFSRDELLKKARTTTNSRFAAYRRLNKKGSVSVIIFSIFSIIVIVISTYIMLFSDKLGKELSNYLSFSLIITSIITAVFQLYEIKQNYEKRAFVLYKCSILLSEFCNDANLRDEKIPTDMLIDRYHSIIREYEENHEDIDYKYKKYNMYNSSLYRILLYALKYHFACFGTLYFYVLFMTISLMAAYYAFFGIIFD